MHEIARATLRAVRRREWLERTAHVAALWGFAVVAPLFHLLGRHPEFFAARGTPSGDIVALAVAIAVLPPLVLLGIEWLAALVSDALGRAVHIAYVVVLTGLIVLQVVPLDAWLPAVALAAIGGAAAGFAYTRATPARSVLTVLSPAPFVFVAIFLAASDVSPLVLDPGEGLEAPGGGARAPVVLVILDELPVHSLMTAGGGLDARRYPNFARLAADATWYRNTTSVDQDTPYAVPAILDGRLPRQERLPVAADHPRNIFSLLGGSYELHVREDATTLCSPRLCSASAREGFGERIRSLSGDAGRLYAHLVLPDRVEAELPAVKRTWRRFEAVGETEAAVADTRRTRRETKRHRYRRLHRNLAGGRKRRFEEFVAGIAGGSQSRLHLIHILLPHVPYQYLPSGRRYRRSPREALPGLDGRPGYSVPFLVRQSYERHLLQLEATDRLLGRLLDRLHEVGIYDRAIVAVVADHGISFRLGHDRRLVRAANIEDIAPVPFFVKAPGQDQPRISDRPLRTVDVLPTLADLLGVRIPWPIDGRSAGAPTVGAQRHRRIVSKRFRHVYEVDSPTYEHELRAALARKLRLFGTDVYAGGPRPELLGRRLADLRVLPLGRDRAVIASAGVYRDVDRRTGFVPAHVAGRVEPGLPGGGRVVALAVNGTIAATGRTFTLEDEATKADEEDEEFSLLLPERALRQGRNRLELVLASGALRRLGGVR